MKPIAGESFNSKAIDSRRTIIQTPTSIQDFGPNTVGTLLTLGILATDRATGNRIKANITE